MWLWSLESLFNSSWTEIMSSFLHKPSKHSSSPVYTDSIFSNYKYWTNTTTNQIVMSVKQTVERATFVPNNFINSKSINYCLTWLCSIHWISSVFSYWMYFCCRMPTQTFVILLHLFPLFIYFNHWQSYFRIFAKIFQFKNLALDDEHVTHGALYGCFTHLASQMLEPPPEVFFQNWHMVCNTEIPMYTYLPFKERKTVENFLKY